jgi:hypothetical protein
VNHFIGLIIISIMISAVFSLLNRDEAKEQIRHFFLLLGYMVVGSLIVAWIMYFLPL